MPPKRIFALDKTLTAQAQISAALAHIELLNGDIEAGENLLNEVNGKVTALESQLSTANQTISTVRTELDAAKKSVTEFDAKVESAAAKKSVTISASQGIPPIPEARKGGETPGAGDANSLDGIRAQIKAEKDPRKKAALAAKARVLRESAQ